MTRTIVHVAEIRISQESGMGRIAWHWKSEFENRGYRFIHIGRNDLGTIPHRTLFPAAAHRAYRNLNLEADLFLVHEPSSVPFLKESAPTFLFSHGIERRGWNVRKSMPKELGTPVPLKSRVLYPLLSLPHSEEGLKRAYRLMLSNNEDADFAREVYGRSSNDIFVFRNGIYPTKIKQRDDSVKQLPQVLFLGSWLERKGIKTLVKAAEQLDKGGTKVHWILAGTGVNTQHITNIWPAHLLQHLDICQAHSRANEDEIVQRADVFVLPSHFEGQPLALLQAMAAGRCCITTNCCGQKDLIAHRQNGLLHSPGDWNTLANLLREAICDDNLRQKLGHKARQSVENRDWSTVSGEVVNHIETSLCW